jgi:asparagine synthetase B (glutamine-hydrolysing)
MGVHLDNLSSCPPGHVVRISKGDIFSVDGDDISSRTADKNFDLEWFRRKVAGTLDAAMLWLKSTFPNTSFAISLSGGLDSSVVASLAKKNLKSVVAVCFSLLSERDAKAWLEGVAPEKLESVSEDFLSAFEVAKALDMPFFPIFRTSSTVLSAVRNAAKLCQDWRDFNVHCAVVNLFLAQDLRALFPDRKVVVLTGDLMNEFICDYHEEVIDGTVYYPQPRVPIENRRRFFIRGLDAGDREIGVFYAYGLPVCQVFSTVAEHYLRVPGEVLSHPEIKETLNGHLLAPILRDKVSKSKRRAQVGGVNGGILGIFHRLGLDQHRLKEMWIDSLPVHMRGDKPLDIIQFGRYRTTPQAR